MSEQYPGGFITKANPTVDGSTARGLWTLSQAAGYAKQGLWPTVPAAPTIGTATAGSGSASVAFTAPSNIGSSAITSYTATSSPGGFTGTGASSPITVSGLTNGTAYTFTVTATNGAGTGPASSASNSVTPDANYIESVFSTYLYTGNGSTQTITNGIDLSTKGGLTWIKSRTSAANNFLFDTTRGINTPLISNGTQAQATYNPSLYAFTSSGFSVDGSVISVNNSATNYASWTFRKQPKFFDVVTWTGDGTARNISHSLGSVPGCVIIKRTDTTSNWMVSHRGSVDTWGILNGTNAFTSSAGTGTIGANGYCYLSGSTDTYFRVVAGATGYAAVNATGGTYVAYLFAHDAGGFGLTGTDNVISCGSYTASGTSTTITLGYEPQWVLIKKTNVGGDNWRLLDTMRGMTVPGSTKYTLAPNLTAVEESWSDAASPSAIGFTVNGAGLNDTGDSYIYIAIRRGPMKVPTSGTSVFSPTTYTGNGATGQTITSVGFPLDFVFDFKRAALDNKPTLSRLTANNALYTNLSDAQNPLSTTAFTFDVMNGFKLGNSGDTNGNGDTFIAECFRRAPSFFDEVCYTGTGANRTLSHNLQAVPELIICKTRSGTDNWAVYSASTGATKFLILNLNFQAITESTVWNNTSPTSTQFTVGTNTNSNGSGSTYVAYLFATCAGVSKVGSYTGTGATQTISCGFTGGARFVLIKRTDSTGDWYVWDTARGMVSGTDPSLLLNSTAAEVNANSIYTTTGGFQIVSTAAGINASGGSYIFLAIA